MKIATICGVPNQNTGMMFVDRALYLYLKKKELLEYTTFFCFELEAKNKVGFLYEPLTSNVNLNEFDCVIIWGDFIISNHFLSMTEPKMKKKSELFNYNLQRKVLMSDFSVKELKKVIVFGQCIAIDNIMSLRNELYIKDLKRLLSYTGLIKLRDPLSVYRANLLSDVDRDFLGIDASLLNCTIDSKTINGIRENIIKDEKNKKVGIFFARSKQINFKKKILGYYLKLKLKNFKFKWIPWLENKQDSKKYFSFASECNPYSDIDYITEILKCDVIITDTYHLSLMSWSLGVPCICYGNAAEYFKLTVHDKKKEIFFISNFIDEFYFYTENFFSDLKSGVLLKIIGTAINTNIGEVVSEKIAHIAKKNIDLLDETLDLLEK